MENFEHTTDWDTTYFDMIVDTIENMEFDDIDYLIENDGIGAYEYWGAKGYDHGTDYLLIEEPTTVKINVNLSRRAAKHFAELVLDLTDEINIIGTVNDTRQTKVEGKVEHFELVNGGIEFDIRWDDENPIG